MGRTGDLSRRDFLKASAATAAVAACAPSGSSPGPDQSAASLTPRRGGTLRILDGLTVATMDPHFSTAGAATLSHQIFGTLFDLVGNTPTAADLVPQLAQSWEETDTTLTLKLRQGVKFHNGREFTSQDVVDNIARTKDSSIGHSQFAIIDPTIASADAVDRYTARLNYKSLHPAKFEDLTQTFIIPKEAMADVAKTPFGTGGFKLVRYVQGSTVELERFDSFWQKDQPYVDRVVVQIMPDPQARVANMLAGAGDIMTEVPMQDYARLEKEPNLRGLKVASRNWDIFVMNCAVKPFDDQRVRQAMNYTLDREKINRLAYFGQLQPSQREFFKDQWAYHAAADTKYTFDLARAKSLLAQAGYPSGLEVSIGVGQRPQYTAAAQVWAQDLAQIGVRLKINELEAATFTAEFNRMQWQIFVQAAGNGIFDPQSTIRSPSYRPEQNRARIETQPFYEEYRSLWVQGLATRDVPTRKRAYDRIQDILSESAFVMVLGFAPKHWIINKRVQGFKTFPGTAARMYFAPVWLQD